MGPFFIDCDRSCFSPSLVRSDWRSNASFTLFDITYVVTHLDCLQVYCYLEQSLESRLLSFVSCDQATFRAELGSPTTEVMPSVVLSAAA